MRKLTTIAMLSVGVLALAMVGDGFAAKAKRTREAVTLTPDELKWKDVPDSGGITVAEVWGSMAKGAHGAFAKFPPGHENPLHTHSADIKVVVVSGTFTYGPEGGAVKRFGPGSYVMIPGGLKHTSGCDPGSPCLLFQEQPARFDLKPAAPPPRGR